MNDTRKSSRENQKPVRYKDGAGITVTTSKYSSEGNDGIKKQCTKCNKEYKNKHALAQHSKICLKASPKTDLTRFNHRTIAFTNTISSIYEDIVEKKSV